MLSTYPLLPHLQVPHLKGQGAGAHKTVSTKQFLASHKFSNCFIKPFGKLDLHAE